jgi:phosphoglycerate dehydrogenase-like enzyme
LTAPEGAEALVWLEPLRSGGLEEVLERAPGIRWVQVLWAGVEQLAAQRMLDGRRAWTSGKGIYSEAVAEHALALALAGVRDIPDRARAMSWGKPSGRTLFGARVTILGGGGIARSLLALLAPLRVEAIVLRRRPEPLPGAARVVGPGRLHEVLPGADLVVLALALTPETAGIIGSPELAMMEEHAWLVNVARGAHVRTDDLVTALRDRWIAGAALDVTEPEPLPDGHPLWGLPNCLITPHTADTPETTVPLLGARITENVRRFAEDEELIGLVDRETGY